MENTGILAITTAVSLLVGAPVLVAAHVLCRHYWPRLSVLTRYGIGTATLCLCLSVSLLIIGAWQMAIAPWIAAAILGAATWWGYNLDARQKGSADAAEIEVRDGSTAEKR